MLHQRDQFSGKELPISDEKFQSANSAIRERNRKASELFKSKGGPIATKAQIKIGSLVHVKSEGDKTKGRNRYIVTNIIDDNMCHIQKFTKNQRAVVLFS